MTHNCLAAELSVRIAARTRQAEISADLRLFGVCSRLLADG
jgi:hypothetical protein